MPLQQLAYVYFNVEGVRPCSSMVSGINLLHSSDHRIAGLQNTPESRRKHATSPVSSLIWREARFAANGSRPMSYIAYDNPDKYLSEMNALNVTHYTTSSGLLGLSLQERSPRTHDLRPQHHLPICSNVRPVPFHLVALQPSP
jgi:hypothetical protein